MAERVGQQLGNYRLIRLLGKGGFAEVYLGEHVYLKTPAAIKLMQTKVAHENDLEDFLKEAQTIAQLVHPHIVRVLEFGLDGQSPFLVMDYAPNGTLRQRHTRGSQLPLATIIPYVKQIAEALQFAHEEKFIHRDVKPENMLVGRRDAILLSDFGIALIAQSSRYQSTQEVIGTVAYMSPEQIQGKPRPASDQYSLGIVVYEWLSGDRPFHGSFTELCTQHLFASPPPLHEKLPTVSSAVEQVVMTALAKDPKQRFATVWTFANALEQASELTADNTSLKSWSPLTTKETSLQSQPPLTPEPVTPSRQSSTPMELIASARQAVELPIQATIPIRERLQMNNTVIPPSIPVLASSSRLSNRHSSRRRNLLVLAGLVVAIATIGIILFPLLIHLSTSSRVNQAPGHTPTSSEVTYTSANFGSPIDMTSKQRVTIIITQPSGNAKCSPDCFNPINVKVKVGTTITWLNQSPILHTITAIQGTNPGALTPEPSGFDSGLSNPLQMNWSFTYTVNMATYNLNPNHTVFYFDRIHPQMVAELTIVQ